MHHLRALPSSSTTHTLCCPRASHSDHGYTNLLFSNISLTLHPLKVSYQLLAGADGTVALARVQEVCERKLCQLLL